ncbi:O-antigen ligase family protein [Candidatus Pelagibacter ubique]|jgi:O-antigen ligase|nr:O-antigen ligase family protein [Candidatus Pelagibacter ubique]
MKNELFLFNFIPSWIIILMPALLISGPFLSDLGLSLVAILFLINSIKNNLKKYYNNYYFKFFFIFCLILILSSLLSDNILVSLKNSLFYFRFGIFSLCFWYLLEKNPFLLKYLFISMLLCFSSLIVDGYIQFLFGKNLFGQALYNGYRVSSFFGSELILGSYMARFFPILFALFIFLDQPKKNKLILFFMTIVFIMAEGLIFISGERLALFFMNLSAVFIILMIKEYKIYRLWTYILSLCLIIVLMSFFPNSKERFIDKTIYDFTRNSDDKVYIFSKPHNDMYITGYRIFLDNKFFGVGPRQFRNTCDQDKYNVSEYSCETHPHNTYIELLSEAGIPAFLLVAGLFILICYLSIKHFIFKLMWDKKGIINDFEVCLLSAILISLWPFSPSGSFFNNWMSIVYYFPVGLLLWQRAKSKNPIK